jgi:hypothetical protein
MEKMSHLPALFDWKMILDGTDVGGVREGGDVETPPTAAKKKRAPPERCEKGRVNISTSCG